MKTKGSTMKRLIFIVLAAFFLMGMACNIHLADAMWIPDGAEKKAPFKEVGKCPESRMTENGSTSCLACHVVVGNKFTLKEAPADAWRVYPDDTKIVDGVGIYELTTINSYDFGDFVDYMHRHKIKEWIIEIHSPGGSVFEAYRMVGMIENARKRGIHVTTKCDAMAFSGGFIIFIAGEARLVAPHANLMWHEMLGVEWSKIVTPSSKDTEAEEWRWLQNKLNGYVASKGKFTKEEIDKKVHYRNWWMTGTQAIEYGYATGLCE